MATANKNKGLKAAIQAKDEAAVVVAVDAAVKLYKSEAPAEVEVNTAFGYVPMSMVLDEDTKWQTITGAYVAVTQAVKRIPAGADVKVETAKIIATNAVLRNISTTTDDVSGLL